MADRIYRAICFDLDGTLLPLDLSEFMKAYFKALHTYVARFEVAPEIFSAGMKAGIRAMAVHDDGSPNSDAFWEGFFTHVERDVTDWEEAFMQFYNRDFGAIGKTIKPNPLMAQAIDILSEKNYPLVLTTMPMFPLSAIKWRLEWAGVDPSVFARITSYNNSTSTKPKLSYYAENLAALGVVGKDVLMVGNNTKEDLAFMELGADAFLVTDFLLDPIGFKIDEVRNGSFEMFVKWAEKLPVCADPATGIKRGLVHADARESALAACAG